MRTLFFGLAVLLSACSSESKPQKTVAQQPIVSKTVVPESWAVQVQSIRYDPALHQLFVQASLTFTAAQGAPARTEPVHVGVTAVSSAGVETDLMVQTLFAGSFDAPILFSTELTNDVSQVLIGVWNTRIEPCQVDRSGCREYGFVLDNSLASWPKGLYTEGIRQRIPPNPYAVTVIGDASKVAIVKTELGTLLSVYGGEPSVKVASERSGKAGVFVTNLTDRALARALTARLPGLTEANVHVEKTYPEGEMVVVLP